MTEFGGELIPVDFSGPNRGPRTAEVTVSIAPNLDMRATLPPALLDGDSVTGRERLWLAEARYQREHMVPRPVEDVKTEPPVLHENYRRFLFEVFGRPLGFTPYKDKK